MKTTAFAVALFGLVPAALAQSVAPSPTESYGCQPHGDHWHCEGARTATGNAATTPAAVVTTVHDHDHTDAPGSGALAPSPTASVGCEPHGDHWHCSGPRTALDTVVITTSAAAAAAAVSTPHEDHDHDHTDAAGSGSLAPSPIASIGCEPHGDHWHCSGPRTSGAAVASTPVTTPAASASAAATSQPPATQVVNGAGLDMVPMLGMVAAAMLAI